MSLDRRSLTRNSVTNKIINTQPIYASISGSPTTTTSFLSQYFLAHLTGLSLPTDHLLHRSSYVDLPLTSCSRFPLFSLSSALSTSWPVYMERWTFYFRTHTLTPTYIYNHAEPITIHMHTPTYTHRHAHTHTHT